MNFLFELNQLHMHRICYDKYAFQGTHIYAITLPVKQIVLLFLILKNTY